MTTGYTPLFASLTTGTLCGRWPDIGLWPVVLSLADRHGIIDVTPAYLSSVTGLPVDQVAACMQRFCEPDPYSRSTDENGARLALIDPSARNWGWRVVNHAKYREKARKSAYDADRTASGKDAERKLAEREASRHVPARPDVSREVPLSDQSRPDQTKDTDTRPQERPARARPAYERQEFHDHVIGAYHDTLPELPGVKEWNDRRRKKLNARITERLKVGKPADQIGYWRDLFAKVAASDFLTGKSSSGWRCPGLEWLLEPKNFTKVIEGSYDNTPRGKGANHGR